MSINFENVLYDDLKNICRTCTVHSDIKITHNNIISDIYFKLIGIDFATNDDLPQHICLKCYDQINEIYKFVLLCEQSHSNLLKYLKKSKLKRSENPDVLVENVEVDRIKQEIIGENEIAFVETEENNPLEYDCNEFVETQMDIKTETTENMDTSYYLLPTISPNFIETDDEAYVLSEDSSSSYSSIESSVKMKYKKKSKKNNKKNEKKEKEIYKCKTCNKTFKYVLPFKKHMSLSDCERPFKCTVCPGTFVQSGDLKRHMRIHSNERPYACDKCPQKFYASNNLQTHLRTHTGERPFTCQVCAKSFTQSCGLTRHMITHSGARPYECAICDMHFSYTNQLKRHNKKFHSDEVK